MTKYFPYGYQSQQSSSSTTNIQEEDDIYSSSMYYNSQNSLLYVVGSTYSRYFDDDTASNGDGGVEEGADNHLENSSCFLSIYKLPTEHNGSLVTVNSVEELLHMDESSNNNNNNNVGRESINTPKLIYSKILGTSHNTEVCSNVIQLPRVHDALLNTNNNGDDIKIKLALIGHVQPTPITSEELAVLNQDKLDNSGSDSTGGLVEFNIGQKKPDNNRSLLLRSSSSDMEQDKVTLKSQQQGEQQQGEQQSRELENIESSNMNHGGFLHSISTKQKLQPITTNGKVYGFVADYDLSISTSTEEVSVTAEEGDKLVGGDKQGGVYGALLGGTTLESSPLIYPTSITQNERIPNELYVVSLHSDDTTNDEGEVLNPEYKAEIAFEVVDGELKERADVTLGGAGLGKGSELVGGGVPKYGTNFYVNVQQVSITPYEELMNIEPSIDEHVKQTMKLGWSFGFKLNDAEDVRPSFIKYIKGRTVDEDLLLLGGTTRKLNDSLGNVEYDGFITKLNPPPPTPVEDVTSGSTVEEAMHENEDQHPTKRIDSTTGRDETVTGICLPPPDPISGLVKHAYIVGSTSSNDEASLAYLLKIQLHDLSTVWKQRIPSIHPAGLNGDVLGEGCSVSPNGKFVYLAGTIDGGSALDTRILPSNKSDEKIVPVGGKSDVFVASFDTDFGSVHWAKQLGTVYEDKLARGGGIECDNEGNVIIMGNTRGGLQRYRPERSDPTVRLASDIFIMSLSREDGTYVNAPFVGGGASRGGLDSASLETSAAAEANDTVGGGLSTGAKGGIAAIFIFWGVLALFIVGRRRSRRRYNEQNSKNWEKRGGDDFIYDNNRPLGGRRDSSSLREPWDDNGSSGRNRITSWISSIRSPGSGESSDSSIANMGSSSSASSKKMEENSDFLASLRQEANETMKKMISRKDTPPDSTDMFETNDPRLDGGASIRDLLATYRDVKKKSLVDDENKDGSPSVTTSKRNPPPPPPRRRRSSHDADGLADFSII